MMLTTHVDNAKIDHLRVAQQFEKRRFSSWDAVRRSYLVRLTV